MTTLKKQTKVIIYNYVIYIFISIALIVTINHYGLKAIDGIRAFTSGESFYMKAQQEASRNLTNYVFTSDQKHYKSFLHSLQVPLNDSLARNALDSNKTYEITKKHLLLAKNTPEDIDNIIWVYKNFKSLGRFKKAIKIWQDADVMISELEILGYDVKAQIEKKQTLSNLEKVAFAEKIDIACRLLTKKGDEFDSALTASIKIVTKTVLAINTLIAFIIFFCIIGLSVKYIHRLAVLQNDTLAKNAVLNKTNQELDLFTHSVSHDLRSPITSLKGIIALAENEPDVAQRKEYFSLMGQILNRQDEFILKIIQFSKNKRIDIGLQEIYLPSFFKIIVQDLQYGVDAKMDISYDIAPINIKIDTFRLDIICRNLLSNAFKYFDTEKENPFVHISAKTLNGILEIVFEDNGLGVQEEHLNKIFDMFYVTSHQNKGSGIGLYLVKEMVNNLGGEIELTSIYGQGSKFRITLPFNG
ncbi:MAG: HAMP domain-containing histidine kinase [Pedobacter sp.]|nr:MAG: HAMP domain-containing histidine kinase [Pedobacter sp.]